MGLFDIFRRKGEVAHKEEKKAPLYPQRKEDNKTQAMLKDIAKKLKAHDRYVKDNVAKELSIKQLLETLEKRFQSIRIDSEDKPMKRLPKLTANHEKILTILSMDMSKNYTYEQLADMTRLSPTGIRGMISELRKMGFTFATVKEGRKARVRLEPSIKPIPSASIA